VDAWDPLNTPAGPKKVKVKLSTRRSISLRASPRPGLSPPFFHLSSRVHLRPPEWNMLALNTFPSVSSLDNEPFRLINDRSLAWRERNPSFPLLCKLFVAPPLVFGNSLTFSFPMRPPPIMKFRTYGSSTHSCVPNSRVRKLPLLPPPRDGA